MGVATVSLIPGWHSGSVVKYRLRAPPSEVPLIVLPPTVWCPEACAKLWEYKAIPGLLSGGQALHALWVLVPSQRQETLGVCLGPVVTRGCPHGRALPGNPSIRQQRGLSPVVCCVGSEPFPLGTTRSHWEPEQSTSK